MPVQFYEVYLEGELINDMIDWNAKLGLQAKSNQVTLNLKNYIKNQNSTLKRRYINPDGTLKVAEDQTIEVYYDEDTAITKSNEQLIITGKVNEIKPKLSGDKNIIGVKARDHTYLMLNRLWSKNYPSGTIDNASEVIINVVQHISSNQAGGFHISTNNVAITQSDSSAFPTLGSGNTPTIELVFKTIYEWVQTLSQPEYTGEDKGMLFWVDKDLDLHWVYPTTTTTGSLTEGRDDIIAYNFTKSTDSRINMVIYTAGKDKTGASILWYYFDPQVETKQFAFKFQPMEDVSRDYRRSIEVARTTLNETLTNSDTTISITDASSFSASGTIRIDNEFIDYSGVSTNDLTGCTRGVDGTPAAAHDDGTIVIDETTYAATSNSNYRTACETKANDKSKAIIQKYGGLRWKGTIERRGKCSKNQGDLDTLTFPSFGFTNKKLRIKDIQYYLDMNGFRHNIEYEEDEKAISAGV